MEPRLVKIFPPANQSCVVKKSFLRNQEPWHYHSDYEILLTVRGKGYVFVGNQVKRIEEGSLMLMGANVPHSSQKDAEYYESHPEEDSLELVIQFGDKLLGRDFFQLPEFTHIREMLHKAEKVIAFGGKTREQVSQKIHQLYDLDPATRIVQILDILNTLAKSDEVEYVLPVAFHQNTAAYHDQRLNRVFEYTVRHLGNEISLEQVASEASMTPSAFCRYFKKHTRKSYIEYLNELRVSYVCTQLIQSNDAISDIVFRSGFQNLSNFNRKFKETMGLTPQSYRRQFTGSVG
ncbi:MAG: AraC family transcriptional regulator [Spirosomaceae bacterium]|jgi:AraC-like DNA-binding protein|nr:AraC family transcriptional regulator [Spirosomataceae bacterium]